jgi:exonuclease V gamma subunit
LEGNTPFLVAMSIAAATTPPAKHLSSNRDTMRETERVGERERGERQRFLFLHREGSPL